MKLILASNSPRRKQLLSSFGFDFEVVVSSFNESDEALSPQAVAKQNAMGKAKDVFNSLTNKSEAIVLGADTVVYLNSKILGKPENSQEAIKMLKSLSGKTHTVVTGYCLVSEKKVISGAEESSVVFNELDDEMIEKYVLTGLPLDKAGAYGIQDGFNIVKKCIGSINNVIGLPIEEIAPIIKECIGQN